MSFLRHAATIAALLLCLPLHASHAKDAVKRRAEAADRASADSAVADGLHAMISTAKLDDFKRFREEWYGTPVGHAPHLATTDRVHRGEPFVVAVAYGGCAPKDASETDIAAGKVPCAARLDLRMTDPAGKTSLSGNDLSLADQQPAAPAGIVQLSPVTLQITFDATDADGPYRIEATVDDPDNNRVLRIATTVELLPDASAP